VVSLPLDFGLSFAAFEGGGPGLDGTDVKVVQAKVFIPSEIADIEHGKAPLTKASAAQLNQRFGSTIIALRALPFEKATADDFLKALQVTNSIVAFVGHAPVSTDAHGFWHALALIFSNSNLTLGQAPIENGFSPKAKVVFLAVCGIDDNFLAQWHLRQAGQALIVPVYAPIAENGPANLKNEINLRQAAADLQYWLDQFTAPGPVKNVGQALSILNDSDQGQNYHWQVMPPAGTNVTFVPPSH